MKQKEDAKVGGKRREWEEWCHNMAMCVSDGN